MKMTTFGKLRRAALPAIALTALVLATTPGQAQQPPSQEEMEQMARERMEEMRDRLQLTDEQEEQIRPILAESARKARGLRDKYMSQERSRDTMMAMRDEMQKLQKQTRKKLEPILSTAQLAEYDKIQEERQQERRRRMGGPRRP